MSTKRNKLKYDIADDILKRYQKDYDESIFRKKSPKDKLKCLICGGHYTRQKKSLHDKTSKHRTRKNELIYTVYDLMDY
jgi:hypothetical protein